MRKGEQQPRFHGKPLKENVLSAIAFVQAEVNSTVPRTDQLFPWEAMSFPLREYQGEGNQTNFPFKCFCVWAHFTKGHNNECYVVLVVLVFTE